MCTLILSGCTRGHLEYIDKQGQLKTACETEYTWQPSVDKYAVQYVLAYCARKAEQQGLKVLNNDLLKIDLSLPPAPNEKKWDIATAKMAYEKGEINERQYGFIIAHIDLSPH
jgi:hypothetical protein